MNGAIPFFGPFDYTPSDFVIGLMLVVWIVLLVYLMYKARQWRKDVK